MSRPESAFLLTPRTQDQNVDLGMLLFRQQLPRFLRIWALCTLPACAVVYALAYFTPQGLLFALFAFMIASAPLGCLTVGTCFQLLKGESPALAEAWRTLGPSPLLLVLRCIAMRLLQFVLLGCFLIPGLLLMNHDASFVEDQLFLREYSAHGSRRLGKKQAPSETRTRGDSSQFGIAWLGLWFMLVLSADLFASRLLGFPLLLGRVSFSAQYGGFEGIIAAFWSFVLSDPVFSVVLVSMALLAYQVVRIGSFLAYCDDRIRRECFDVELRVRDEVARLAPAGD